LAKEPNTIVVCLPSWRTETAKGGWRQWLADESVLIVDEAQTSYWDTNFWAKIQDIDKDSPFRLITFASYGSTGADASFMIPHYPYQTQVVGLRAVDYGDGVAVGLLLTEREFHDFISKKFSGHRFDDAFLEAIYDLTTGHVGACKDLLEAIQAHDVSACS
jgi:hypothetical protein